MGSKRAQKAAKKEEKMKAAAKKEERREFTALDPLKTLSEEEINQFKGIFVSNKKVKEYGEVCKREWETG